MQQMFTYFIVCMLALKDLFYVCALGNQEMVEQGRVQYQLMEERGALPRYGSCWKSAVEHLHEGCGHLSEDTQSDIALHITNCFLEMSGHETYNCELDKKPNLRGICISNMPDRAFNVYTEFYTHTQNICWFLRGQIWHETIAENTLIVGKQLEISAQNQEDLLKAQKESLHLQEKMLRQGKFLEQILEDLFISTKAHQEILMLLTQSVANLQSWIVGEISWIDSIIFYASATFLIFILTSFHRTISARFPLFLLLFFNLILERFICSFIASNQNELDTRTLYNDIYKCVWYSRYAFTFLGAFILIYTIFKFKNLAEQNYKLLNKLQKQNSVILEAIENLNSSFSTPKRADLEIVSEINLKALESKLGNLSSKENNNHNVTKNNNRPYLRNSNMSCKEHRGDDKEDTSRMPKKRLYQLSDINIYNLRSRQGTPDSIVI